MQTRRATTGTGRALAWIALVLAVVAIWGHFQEQRVASSPDPATVEVTQTWSVFGRWPYVIVENGAADLRWFGLLLGLAATAVVGALAARWLRRVPPATA